MNVRDTPPSGVSRPDHGLIPAGVDRPSVHRGGDRVLARYERHVLHGPDFHIRELGLGPLECFDFGAQVVIPHVVQPFTLCS